MNRLFWNDIELELGDQTKIGMTYQVNNVGELQSRQGNFSNIFKIPKTSKNKITLGFSDNVNSNSSVPYNRGSIDYFEGEIAIVKNGIGIVENVDSNFNIRVSSGNSSFIGFIDNITVGSLYQEIPRGDFVWLIHEEIVDSRDGSKPYIFPLVDHFETGNLIDFTDIIDERRLYPHLFIKDILERVADRNNITLEGSFIESDIYPKLLLSPDSLSYAQAIIKGEEKPNPDEPDPVLPFYSGIANGFFPNVDPQISGNIPATGIGGGTFTYYFDTDSPAQFLAYFNSGFYIGEPTGDFNDTIGFYGTIPFSYELSFKVTNTNINFTPAIEYGITLQLIDFETNEVLWEEILLDADDDDYTVIPFDKEGSASVTNTWRPYQKLFFRVRVKLQEAQTTGFDYTVSFSSSGGGFNQSPKFNTSGLDHSFNSSQVYGGIFYFNQFFNILVKDLIKDVMNMFAVTLDYNDQTKTAKFYFNSDIIKNKANYVDWSNKKIDVNTIDIRFVIGDYGQKNNFLYAPNDTVLNGYGNSFILIENNILPLEKNVVELKVSATESDIFSTQSGLKTIPRIKFRSGSIGENKVNNRILILDIENTTYNLTFSDLVSDTPDLSTNTNIPFAYFEKTGADENLNFVELVEKYYSTFKVVVNNSKKITVYILLNSIDISTLNFIKPVYINVQEKQVYAQGYFYINQIYQYKGGLTKVELIKI